MYHFQVFKIDVMFLYLQSIIFDEIELVDLSVAECSTKNVNHSFQVNFNLIF